MNWITRQGHDQRRPRARLNLDFLPFTTGIWLQSVLSVTLRRRSRFLVGYHCPEPSGVLPSRRRKVALPVMIRQGNVRDSGLRIVAQPEGHVAEQARVRLAALQPRVGVVE